MKKLFLLILILLLIMVVHPTNIFSQQVQNVSEKRTTPARAAEGQTKWMMSQLKLNKSHYDKIYSINLKYQVKIDSIHLSKSTYAEKRKLYRSSAQRMDDDFKKTLSADVYNNYILLKESIKQNAPHQ